MKVLALLAATTVAVTTAEPCNLVELPAVFGADLVSQVSECTAQAHWNLLAFEEVPTEPTKQAAVCKYCGDVFPKIQAKKLPSCELPFPSKPISLKALIDKIVHGCSNPTAEGGNLTAKATQKPFNSTNTTQLPKVTKVSNQTESDLPEPTKTTKAPVKSSSGSKSDETNAPSTTPAATEAQKKVDKKANNAGVLSISAVATVMTLVAAYFN